MLAEQHEGRPRGDRFRRRLLVVAVAGDAVARRPRVAVPPAAVVWQRSQSLPFGTTWVCSVAPGSVTGIVAYVRWDLEDLVAAYAELDARWQAGEAVSHPRVAAYQSAFVRALTDREWGALASLHAPSLVAWDHRLVGWDELRGPVAYVGASRAMVDLAPDALARLDHLRTSEHGLIAEIVWVGTRDGGAFESPFLWVVELGAEGRAQRLDFYDPHHLDAARARFEALRAHPCVRWGVRDP